MLLITTRMPSSKSQIVLGIDPGLATTGWGVIKIQGHNIQAVDWGVISTSKTKKFPERLLQIDKDLKKLLKDYKPSLVVVEELFFCKNVKTAFQVGQARGVIIMEISRAKIPTVELTPLQVKQSIVGYGKATKAQVQKMVKMTLCLKNLPRPDDAADALALAITGSHRKKMNDKINDKL